MGFKLMFDTNIFDAILDSKLDIFSFPAEYEYYVTHIQKDEINTISTPKKQERKNQLLSFFREFANIHVPTESFVWEPQS